MRGGKKGKKEGKEGGRKEGREKGRKEGGREGRKVGLVSRNHKLSLQSPGTSRFKCFS